MPVLYEQFGAVGVLTLSRPKARNCWGSDFSEGLAEALARTRGRRQRSGRDHHRR